MYALNYIAIALDSDRVYAVAIYCSIVFIFISQIRITVVYFLTFWNVVALQ